MRTPAQVIRERDTSPGMGRRRALVFGTAMTGLAAVVAPVVSGGEAPRQAEVITVRQGDTLWDIARTHPEIRGDGDVRDAVDRLAEAAGGPDIKPGQDISIIPIADLPSQPHQQSEGQQLAANDSTHG